MKKILLSAMLIIGFGIYAFTQHKNQELAQTPVVIPSGIQQDIQQAQSASTNSNTSSNSGADPNTNSGVASTGSKSSTSSGSTSSSGKNSGSGPASGSTGSGSSGSSGSGSGTKNSGQYKDGVYTGPVVDAFYGNVQVQTTISSGKLTGVKFLQYPNDRSTSRQINGQAMPLLISEAISAQSANVDIVSGASDTSGAFRQSLAVALSQAKN